MVVGGFGCTRNYERDGPFKKAPFCNRMAQARPTGGIQYIYLNLTFVLLVFACMCVLCVQFLCAKLTFVLFVFVFVCMYVSCMCSLCVQTAPLLLLFFCSLSLCFLCVKFFSLFVCLWV